MSVISCGMGVSLCPQVIAAIRAGRRVRCAVRAARVPEAGSGGLLALSPLVGINCLSTASACEQKKG
jgi:hypothetical protein